MGQRVKIVCKIGLNGGQKVNFDRLFNKWLETRMSAPIKDSKELMDLVKEFQESEKVSLPSFNFSVNQKLIR